jgi:glutamate carboxypeptidase
MNPILAALGLSLVFGSLSAGASEADVGLLKKIVEINSGSKNFAGVKEVERVIEGELTALGFSTAYLDNPEGMSLSAPMLVGVLKGKRPDRFVTLVTHADTVFESSSGFLKFSESPDDPAGPQLLGPGVGDDKGGLVIALSGMKQLLSLGHELPYSIRFLVSPNEEVGSPGFESVFKSFAKDSVAVLGFEDAPANGEIVDGRSAISKYTLSITGKEAHAGTNHADGINACIELSQKLVELAKITDYKNRITLNVGAVSGGSEKTNVVCGSASASFEVRYPDVKTQKLVQAKIEKILRKVFVHSSSGNVPSITEFTLKPGRPPFGMNAKSRPYIAKYREILTADEDRPIQSGPMGGSADVSYLAGPDMIVIDDLGAVGGAAHTKEEHILKSSLVTRSKAFVEFMRWFFARN